MKYIISKNSYELAKELAVRHRTTLSVITLLQTDLDAFDKLENNIVSTFKTHFKYNPYFAVNGRELPRYDMDVIGCVFICNKLRSAIAMQRQLQNIEASLLCK